MNFPLDEYTIYTTNTSLEKAKIELGLGQLADARLIAKYQTLPEVSSWDNIARKRIREDIYLTVEDGEPTLQSRGYEGWETVLPDYTFEWEERVAFDSMIFYKCIGEHGREPEWSYRELRDEWVNPEDRDRFVEEFDRYYKDANRLRQPKVDGY